jgi:hypothetical protein
MVGSSGRNPARRSKNIGTAAQGFKNRNAFAIPKPEHGEFRFYERLVKPMQSSIALGSHNITVLVEPPLDGFFYYLSVPDLLEVLKLIPETDREDIDLIVFRQPKRKDRIFSPVWGRMAYWAEFGKYSGTSVVIEAIEHDYSYNVGKHIGPIFARELEALTADGHSVVMGTRNIKITCPPAAIRNTQLFRTLPHEIGHNVDFTQKVTFAEGDWDELRDLYLARPQREREQFADRYATDVMAPYRASDIVPFPPLPNFEPRPDWFYFDTPSR